MKKSIADKINAIKIPLLVAEACERDGKWKQALRVIMEVEEMAKDVKYEIQNKIIEKTYFQSGVKP